MGLFSRFHAVCRDKLRGVLAGAHVTAWRGVVGTAVRAGAAPGTTIATSGASRPRRERVTLSLRKGDRVESFPAVVGQTLLEAAHAHGINVDGTCDGDLACSTCHCVVGSAAVYNTLPRKLPQEDDLLASAWDVGETSRLSCQIRVTDTMHGMEIRFPNMLPESKRRSAAPQGVQVSGAPLFAEEEAIAPKKFRNITQSAIPKIFKQYAHENDFLRTNLDHFTAMASILPFRTNNYVVDELIDWKRVPDDPMFQLNFPQPGMLDDAAGVAAVAALKSSGRPSREVRAAADEVRAKLNPHPAKQREMNVPSYQSDEGEQELERGMQHKYRETVLFFPSESQYCHSYCTYCFRWAQFVGSASTQFASNSVEELCDYLRRNRNVTDVLFTGGDPMVLNSRQFGRYVDAITSDPSLEHVQTIRIGSKSLAYWPYKYVTDDDADDMLRLFERTVQRGRHVSFMAHFSHPVELSTPVVRAAIRRIRDTGVQIRSQAPLTNHINNDPNAWVDMWRTQVKLGIVPYYMFVERDTGAKEWFGVPLSRALDVYNQAQQQLSGLARTARGPSMSCTPGKVHVLGTEEINGERVFVLKFLQGRNPKWTDRVFFAQYDEKASWMDQLRPAFGADKFFFEDELVAMERASTTGSGSSGQMFQTDDDLYATA